MFPVNWDISIGDGFCHRTIIDPIVGSGSLHFLLSAENNAHLAVPEGALGHGLLGGRHRFLVNITSGIGSSNLIRAGLAFMCSAKDITTGTNNFYYVGVQVNADLGNSHFIFFRKVTGGTIYDLGALVAGPFATGETGYDFTYALEVRWKITGSNLVLSLQQGFATDYSDLVSLFSGIDTSPFVTSTNESYFARTESGVTSALAVIDNVTVALVT